MVPWGALCALAASCSTSKSDCKLNTVARSAAPSKVVVMVWDGLRPDSVNPSDTPNLAALKAAGVDFADNHSTYPTFTMMNASSLATGDFPATSGFYGNTYWQPGPTGNAANGKPADFQNPVFTEDWSILTDLDAYYKSQGDPGLLLVATLYQQAQARGLVTATVGKRGPAFLQDHRRQSFIIDEDFVAPLSLVQAMQVGNDPVPVNTVNAYPSGTVILGSRNGNPTSPGAQQRMADGATWDASAAIASPWSGANAYMMNMYVKYVLPKKPDVSVIWFRIPDSAEHNYGPGSSVYRDGLRNQDQLLGVLQQALKAQGLEAQTDIIVVSDHGHSSVSGPVSLFPLRAIAPGVDGAAGTVGAVDAAKGYSVSGDVRLAELLNNANLGVTAYDGAGCSYQPVLSGLLASGAQIAPDRVDVNGTVCNKGANFKYTFASHGVPNPLPATGIVVAANGGSAYLTVLPAGGADPALVRKVVAFLQSREEVGPIFVAGKYGAVPGTVSLDKIKLEGVGTGKRQPDIVLSYTWDDQQVVQGLPGIEFEDAFNNRGMHGSFSPIDVHNTLIARGPDFKASYRDPLPSGNVDVAPTVAAILDLTLDAKAEGRPLYEALTASGVADSCYARTTGTIASTTAASPAAMFKPTAGVNGAANADGTKSYSVSVSTKSVRGMGASSTYFDQAKAVRQ
ncbi:MAG: alkaline phosphatase family protein [Myxococcales bacterium]